MFVSASEPLSIHLFASFWFSHCLIVLIIFINKNNEVGFPSCINMNFSLQVIFLSNLCINILWESQCFQTLYAIKKHACYFFNRERHLEKKHFFSFVVSCTYIFACKMDTSIINRFANKNLCYISYEAEIGK